MPTNSEISAIQYPLIFSLRHPYDDIKPVMTKQGGNFVDLTTELWQVLTRFVNSVRIGAVTDPGQRIVFTSEEPSICMLYSSITGTHSVWSIRKASLQVIKKINNSVADFYVCEFIGEFYS